MEEETTTLLNNLYERFKDDCLGTYHNALWQIMIEHSCTGAFTYIETSNIVGIAQRDGGYIPAGFSITDRTKRDEILSYLNLHIFGLDQKGVLDCELESLKNN